MPTEPWNVPVDNPQVDFLNLLQGINASLAQLVAIEQKRLTLETKNMALTAQSLTQFFTIVTALINADANDQATIAGLRSQLAALAAQDTALQDPALQAQMAALQAAAIAATPPPVVTPPAGNPEGVAFNPALTYVPGDTALDASGNLWTAVTPAAGDQAPSSPNWTKTIVKPPAPALFDPTVTYAAGATVSDASGNVWTAVSPVLGEAPGVTAGNWTETSPAPAPTP